MRSQPWRGTSRCSCCASNCAIRSDSPSRSSTWARPSSRPAIWCAPGRCWRTVSLACAAWGSSGTSGRASTTWRSWPAPKATSAEAAQFAGESLAIKHAAGEWFDVAQCLELLAGAGRRSPRSGCGRHACSARRRPCAAASAPARAPTRPTPARSTTRSATPWVRTVSPPASPRASRGPSARAMAEATEIALGVVRPCPTRAALAPPVVGADAGGPARSASPPARSRCSGTSSSGTPTGRSPAP